MYMILKEVYLSILLDNSLSYCQLYKVHLGQGTWIQADTVAYISHYSTVLFLQKKIYNMEIFTDHVSLNWNTHNWKENSNQTPQNVAGFHFRGNTSHSEAFRESGQ